MRRDARAEIESHAVAMVANSRRTIAAALLQAIDMRVAIVPAARALGEVAADCCEMADLRSSEAQRGGGKSRIRLRDALVGGDGRDGREGPDARRPVRVPFDPGTVG